MSPAGAVTPVRVFGATEEFPALIRASNGDLYGTTQTGGLFDNGTIVRMGFDGIVTIRHSFSTTEGKPFAFMQATDGKFYGTTRGGGTFGSGTALVLSNAILMPPTVVTGTASVVSEFGATLNGTADPDGVSTSGHFEYGLTSGYGLTTSAQDLGSGNGAVMIGGGALTGLACSTLYHFRAVAANTVGTANGFDATFTTASCPAPTAVTGVATVIGLTSAS